MLRSLISSCMTVALMAAATAAAQQALNIRDADIRAFIQDAARVTGRTFIIDNRVQGKVSVVTDRPLSRSEYFEIFLSTLRANGLVAIPTGNGAYRIQPVEGAAGQPGGVGQAANRNGFVTEVFRLRVIDAASALDTLRPLVSREGSVTANRAGNSLVVADYADNVQRIRQLIARIDHANDASEVVMLKNTGAREIAQSLQQLNGTANAGLSVSVVPVDSSNSIALRGDSATVARLAGIARTLDTQAAAGTDIRVYWLEHADAEKLLPVLQTLLGQQVTQAATYEQPSVMSRLGQSSAATGNVPAAQVAAPVSVASAPTTGSTGLAGRGPAVVTRYEGANAIVIAANGDVQRKLGEVIRQLDVRRDQVLVEAIIVEIGEQAARRLGVQFLVGSTDTGFAVTNYSNAQPNILTLAGAAGALKLNQTTTTVNGTTTVTQTTSQLGTTLQEAAVSSLLNATGGFGGVATRIGDNGVFGAIINAVKSDTNSNILSTPSVTTLDNQRASLLVGQEVPVTTGEALSQNFDNQFRTVQRQNVGIQLDVRPQINAGGSIKLYLHQEVSSVAGPVSSRSSDLILNKREIETTVAVEDGEILALGGLLDDNERRTIEKVPLLGDLPAIGALFRSKARTRAKTNLMVFIRPTILRSAEEARAMTAQRYGYVRAQQLLGKPDEEPSLDVLVRDYMGARVPLPAAQAGTNATVVTPDGQAAAVSPPPGPPAVTPVPARTSSALIPLDSPARARRR